MSGCTRFAVAGLIDFEHGAARPKPAADLNYTRELPTLPVLHWLTVERSQKLEARKGAALCWYSDRLVWCLSAVARSLTASMRATTVREWFPTKGQHHAVKALAIASGARGAFHLPRVSRIHSRKWRSSRARIAR